MYRILVEKQATKFLSRLDAKSYRLLSTAIKKLSVFREIKNLDIKPLRGKFAGMMRLRIGSRRVLFTVNHPKKEIRLWRIEDRGDVY